MVRKKKRASRIFALLLAVTVLLSYAGGTSSVFADDTGTEETEIALAADPETETVSEEAVQEEADPEETASEEADAVIETENEDAEPEEADPSEASEETEPESLEKAEDFEEEPVTEEVLEPAVLMAAAPLLRAAGDATERTNIAITDFQIVNTDNSTPDILYLSTTYRLRMSWDASAYGNTLQEGDYFYIDLPDTMRYTVSDSEKVFNITAPDGSVVATGEIDSYGSDGGGRIKVTFTDYVNNRYDIKGTVFLNTNLVRSKVTYNEDNTFTIKAGSSVEDFTIHVNGPRPLDPTNIVGKWGEKLYGSDTTVVWYIRFNFAKANLTNVVLSDTLSVDGGGDLQGMHYLEDSFALQEIELDEYGYTISSGPRVDVSDQVVFNSDKTSFTYNLGDTNGKTYYLIYRSTYVPGVKIRNNVTVTSTEQTKTTTSTYIGTSTAGGTGDGSLNSKIQIIKVDAQDNSIRLAGAVFKITASDGTTFELKTDANGEALSDKLTAGQYTITEVSPPDGYLLNSEEYTVTVTTGGATLQTVKDEPETIDIPVTKTWIGKEADSITVNLLADDVQVDTATVTAADGWKHTFTGLRKYDATDGHEIVYKVEEAPLSNYSTAVSGDAASGFTITNTNDETIDIPVTKTWIGKEADSITVNLLADDVQVDTATVTAADGWKHTFTGLRKYDATDGHEIVYKVEEAPLSNYSTAVSGDAASGFTITNTNDETIDIPVTKTWIGKEADSITVNLLADDVQVDTATVTAADGWKHTFTGLRKYDATDGHEIVYKVEEAPLSNYSTAVSGDAASGFTITNTNDETIDIPVTKTWIGKEADSITVHLSADGARIQTVTVTADDNWTHTFASLAKYDATDGHEIVYEVTEDPIENYSTESTGDTDSGFTFTNTNDETIDIPVTKTWIGKEAESITVNLLADDAQVDTATVTAADGWKHTFTGLRKYDATDGHEIVYTITEDALENYSTEITGDVTDGFTITNTNTETLDIPVTKNWVGTATSSVTVRLQADGTEIDSATITADDNWQHTFMGLPKYDSTDGHEIVYTVTEDAVEDYTTAISGTAETGFTITNTITGLISVPVTKIWVGEPAESIYVSLLADGDRVESVTIMPESGWQHTFMGLPKYDSTDGHEIVYTVTEGEMENYFTEISGDMSTGFTITNTITGKISIPVTKVWEGAALDRITVRLYADGTEVEAATLTAADDWKHTFADLDQYKDGKEIVYTITEDAVEGYDTSITGDMKTGFTITNTKKPEKPNTPNTPPTTPHKPTTPKTTVPKTGDPSNAPLHLIVMLGSLVAIILLLAVRKARSK